MEAIQITSEGLAEILILYHAGARAKYLEVSGGVPQLNSLFDQSGSMTHAWVTPLQNNATQSLIFSSSDNLSSGNYAFTKDEPGFRPYLYALRGVGFRSPNGAHGPICKWRQCGANFSLPPKKVHAITSAENTLIRHEEGITAIGIGNVIAPDDSANEVIIFSNGSKGFHFHQYANGETAVVHGQGLGEDATVTEIVTGDFNEDGFIDFLAASEDEGVFVLYNDNGVGFNVDKASLVNNAHHIEALDIDGDDDLDFGFWSPSLEAAFWVENLPDGQWATHQIRSFSDMSDALFIDIDGDGDQDLNYVP